jgi:hypothetical protein
MGVLPIGTIRMMAIRGIVAADRRMVAQGHNEDVTRPFPCTGIAVQPENEWCSCPK